MNIRVTNTNSSGKNDSAVRVYANGYKIAEVVINTRNPLAYIRRHNGSYRDSLIEQCISGGMSREMIKEFVGV